MRYIYILSWVIGATAAIITENALIEPMNKIYAVHGYWTTTAYGLLWSLPVLGAVLAICYGIGYTYGYIRDTSWYQRQRRLF